MRSPRLFPLLLFLFPVCLGAQTAEQVLETSGLSAGQRTAVLAEFREAEALGIPGAFLLPRLEEGLAKKVPAARIIEVLRRERAAFAQARGLLAAAGYGEEGGAPPAADWQRTAHLLLSGIEGDAVSSLLLAFEGRREDFRDGTNLYLALIQWGIAPEEALELTSAVADSPLDAGSFMGIPEILIEAGRRRIRSEEIMTRIKDQLGRSRSLENLRNRVLY